MQKPEKSNDLYDGKLASIDDICNATWEPLYRFIYYKVQNREEAEDITQEAYAKAISHLQSDRIDPKKHLAFLKTVALNIIRDLWRKSKRSGIKVNLESISPKDHAVEDPTEASTQRMLINDALSQLNEEQRTVIELRILKGYSVAQTAKIMKKKEVTLRVIQHRAIQALSLVLKHNQ